MWGYYCNKQSLSVPDLPVQGGYFRNGLSSKEPHRTQTHTHSSWNWIFNLKFISKVIVLYCITNVISRFVLDTIIRQHFSPKNLKKKKKKVRTRKNKLWRWRNICDTLRMCEEGIFISFSTFSITWSNADLHFHLLSHRGHRWVYYGKAKETHTHGESGVMQYW